MGALCSTQSDVYVEHGSAIAQDVVLSIIDTANTTVGNASRTKGETAPVLWKVVEHNGSSLDVPVDADGKCIDLRDDEVWILAPFAYCAKAGLLDEATRDASGELAYRAILKSTPAYRDGLLEMGGLFVLWRARRPSTESTAWLVRYAGGNPQSFESDVADGPTDRLTYLRRSTNEAKKFAPHMHEVSVPHDQLLAHAHAVLRRYHTFVNVIERDMSS